MGELKNRGYINTTMPIRMIKIIREFSKRTRIPISRLTEEAWEDLFLKYADIVNEIEKDLPK